MTAPPVRNKGKIALRNRIKNEILPVITPAARAQQSKLVIEKVLQSEAFKQADNISIYLSTNTEIDTLPLLSESFRLNKKVFVPTYHAKNMEMVRLHSMQDYEQLPLTKWQIKQPNFDDERENALTNGRGIDLFIMPGVAFTRTGARLGHGMGYYDKFLQRHQAIYAQKNAILMAVAFNEQIVPENELPMEEHDVRLNCVVTP